MNYIPLIIGSSLILFGILFFLRPLIKIASILFLMYIGFSLIADLRTKDQQTFFLSNELIQPHDFSTSSYQTILANNTIDLTNLPFNKKPIFPETLRISTILGKTTIVLNPHISTQVIAHSSGAEILLPDGFTGIFGTKTYNSHQTNPELILHLRTTFGQTVVREK